MTTQYMRDTEQEAYENIIYNLEFLNEIAGEMKPDEQEAIMAILETIADLRDDANISLQDKILNSDSCREKRTPVFAM